MRPFWRLSSVFIAVSLMMTLIVVGVQASGILAWPNTGAPIAVMPNGQLEARSTADDHGGAIIVWQDARSGVDTDIYAQRVNSSGQIQWAANGVSVSTAISDQSYPALASDGLGGAIVVWQDKRNGSDFDIFAQHILSGGVTLWSTNGITIISALDTQDIPQVVGDEQGGAIVVWEDYRSGDHWEVYAQRVAPNGQALWSNEGITLGLVNSQVMQPLPKIVSDGQSGAFVAWMAGPYSDIAVQHVLFDGAKLWTSGGITLTGSGTGVYPELASDGNGGALVIWQSGAGAFVQRVLANGTVAWGSGGIKLMGGGMNVSILSDNAQGAFAAWQAYPNGYDAGSDIFAQHILSDGTPLWNGERMTVTNASGHQQTPQLASDGYGGIIVIWKDTPTNSSLPDRSVWAQRVNSAGVAQWTTNGVLVITGTNGYLGDVIDDQAHGAIVTWIDHRADVGDIYAQRIVDFTATAWVYLPIIRQ